MNQTIDAVTVSDPDNFLQQRAPFWDSHHDHQLPAYISISLEDSSVCFRIDESYGRDIPIDVYNGETIEFSIPNTIKGDVLADFVASDEFRACVLRRCDANVNGELSQGDCKLEQLVDQQLRREEGVLYAAWNAEFLKQANSGLDTYWPSTLTLELAVTGLIELAEDYEAVLDLIPETFLIKLAIDTFYKEPSLIHETHIQALLTSEEIDEDDVNQWRFEYQS